ncbi:unnamed protein product [Mycena citricolor]|uniref:Uncharacterized protein n=1 Tax=Mycena citricolor TaxID=2018698 RepID=A0AAD2HGW6_9AGAR|nr:unnamed protein product [Mycena citricolor]
MKFALLPLAVVSAALAASANPLRVVVVSSSIETVNSGSVSDVPTIHHPSAHVQNGAAVVKHAPCAASRFRQKAKSMAEAFRLALGLSSPPGDKAVRPHYHHHIHKLNKEPQLEHVALPPLPLFIPSGSQPDRIALVPVPAPVNGKPIPHAHAHKDEEPSFLIRVHFALMSLGPWEGRAVAFVLGCGIGVLLRMVWVLMIVSYRLVKGSRSEEDEYTVIEFDAEDLLVAPPQYTFPVEKVAVAETQEEESKFRPYLPDFGLAILPHLSSSSLLVCHRHTLVQNDRVSPPALFDISAIQFKMYFAPLAILAILSASCQVSACEGECIIAVTKAMDVNYKGGPVLSTMSHLSQKIDSDLGLACPPKQKAEILAPIFQEFSNSSYGALEAGIFPGFFHGKCQVNGVDPKGCPNPDCPVVCGTPGSIVHFYHIFRDISFNTTRSSLQAAINPHSAPFRQSLERVNSCLPSKRIRGRATMTSGALVTYMNNKLSGIPTLLLESCGGKGLPDCSWEEAMKTLLLSFP